MMLKSTIAARLWSIMVR